MNAEPEDLPPTDEVRVRRAPRIGMFLIAGAIVGAIVAFILTVAFPIDENVGFGPTLGLLLVYGVPIGVGVAAVIAVIVDWSSSRRAAPAIAEREETRLSESDSQLEPDPQRPNAPGERLDGGMPEGDQPNA
ncbi:hypothetical protein [Ruicaihuangia caeni]|uniref:hypothetical protein n=1 Tax=Ruicaihuangia caeni TaxID=3042517 RepID=UPI00338D9F32